MLRFRSETHSGEYDLPVLLRKHSRSYVDEENWQSVPPEWVVVGSEA